MNADNVSELRLIDDVQRWLDDCVLGLSLCPYARAPVLAKQVRFVVVKVEDDLVESLLAELRRLQQSDAETTLLILGSGLDDFLDFNDLLGVLENWLHTVELEAEFQLVGFHPAYLFAGEAKDDPSNYSNRSPYPLLQILRAASVARVVENGDTQLIPQRNIKTLRSLSSTQLRSLFPWV